MRYDELHYDDNQLFWPVDEVFWKTEPTSEEGNATENQVCSMVLNAIPTSSLCEDKKSGVL